MVSLSGAGQLFSPAIDLYGDDSVYGFAILLMGWFEMDETLAWFANIFIVWATCRLWFYKDIPYLSITVATLLSLDALDAFRLDGVIINALVSPAERDIFG